MRRDDISPELDPRISCAMEAAGFSSPAGAIALGDAMHALFRLMWRGIAWLLTRKHARMFARLFGASSFLGLAIFLDDLGPNAPWVCGVVIAVNVLLAIAMIVANWRRA